MLKLPRKNRGRPWTEAHKRRAVIALQLAERRRQRAASAGPEPGTVGYYFAWSGTLNLDYATATSETPWNEAWSSYLEQFYFENGSIEVLRPVPANIDVLYAYNLSQLVGGQNLPAAGYCEFGGCDFTNLIPLLTQTSLDILYNNVAISLATLPPSISRLNFYAAPAILDIPAAWPASLTFAGFAVCALSSEQIDQIIAAFGTAENVYLDVSSNVTLTGDQAWVLEQKINENGWTVQADWPV